MYVEGCVILILSNIEQSFVQMVSSFFIIKHTDTSSLQTALERRLKIGWLERFLRHSFIKVTDDIGILSMSFFCISDKVTHFHLGIISCVFILVLHSFLVDILNNFLR